MFHVVPAEREIPPNTTVAFDVTFWPVRSIYSDVYYSHTGYRINPINCSLVI